MTKPGENIRVIVRVEDNATAKKLMETVGAHSHDGKSFSVVVTREDGAQQTHDLCYRDRLKARVGFMLLQYLSISILFGNALLSAGCAKSTVHQTIPTGASAPSMASHAGDRRVLAGEWEYIDGTGAAVLLTLDERGNGHYAWKDGRFETHTFIDHTWNGLWFQEENDREGGFTVEFSPDFSEGEGRWWHSRIGTDYAPTQKGGTFHLSKGPTSMSHNDTPPAP